MGCLLKEAYRQSSPGRGHRKRGFIPVSPLSRRGPTWGDGGQCIELTAPFQGVKKHKTLKFKLIGIGQVLDLTASTAVKPGARSFSAFRGLSKDTDSPKPCIVLFLGENTCIDLFSRKPARDKTDTPIWHSADAFPGAIEIRNVNLQHGRVFGTFSRVQTNRPFLFGWIKQGDYNTKKVAGGLPPATSDSIAAVFLEENTTHANCIGNPLDSDHEGCTAHFDVLVVGVIPDPLEVVGHDPEKTLVVLFF